MPYNFYKCLFKTNITIICSGVLYDALEGGMEHIREDHQEGGHKYLQAGGVAQQAGQDPHEASPQLSRVLSVLLFIWVSGADG